MGLLDGFLGNGFDDPRSAAIMALSGGLLQGNFGAGLLGANQAFSEAKKNASAQALQQMQMGNLQSEIDARKAALQKQNDLMDFIRKRSADSQTPQAGSATNFGFGMPTSGAVMRSDSMPTASDWLMRMSPTDQLFMKANGLDATDIINTNKPKWENVNGNLINTNDSTFRGGFQPGFSVSSDGHTTAWMPDGKGGLTFGAPKGALDTFQAYQNVSEGTKAKFDPIKVFNKDTKQDEYVSRDRVAGQPGPNGTSPTLEANRNFILQSELGNARQRLAQTQADPRATAQDISRAQQDVEGLQRELARGTPPQSANFAAGPSMGETNAAAGDKTYQEGVARDVVGQRKNIMDAGTAAPQNIARYQQIGKLLANVDGGTLTPMGTHLASLANSIGMKIDKDLPNKEAAASIANQAALELRSPAGGAGMPGAMSDADRNFLVSMTPNMAQSAQGRKQIIDTYVAVQQRNQQIAQSARNYEKKYGRLDNGYFDQLQAWSNANPLFGGK